MTIWQQRKTKSHDDLHLRLFKLATSFPKNSNHKRIIHVQLIGGRKGIFRHSKLLQKRWRWINMSKFSNNRKTKILSAQSVSGSSRRFCRSKFNQSTPCSFMLALSSQGYSDFFSINSGLLTKLSSAKTKKSYLVSQSDAMNGCHD